MSRIWTQLLSVFYFINNFCWKFIFERDICNVVNSEPEPKAPKVTSSWVNTEYKLRIKNLWQKSSILLYVEIKIESLTEKRISFIVVQRLLLFITAWIWAWAQYWISVIVLFFRENYHFFAFFLNRIFIFLPLVLFIEKCINNNILNYKNIYKNNIYKNFQIDLT
jgi:hypothetical protein